jgi:hypothetical protein
MLQAISQEVEKVMNSKQRHTLAMVREIESLKPIQICEKLRKYGVSPDEGWAGYEKAKKVIFRGLYIDPQVHDFFEKVIIDYLNI